MQRQASSGSDGDVQYAMVDERKKRRMISNRESARRSRVRKQQRLESLVSQVNELQNDNSQMMQKINANTQLYIDVASENNVLRAQVTELTDRLRSLNAVLEIAAEVSGLAMDIPEIPEMLLEPWQLPYPGQPIMASPHTFQC
ncbi:bZIP transcription factor 53 [Malania oleifera]|uniref:bZIP transcription factor 53 n=1 Tax=Malania oleifera TaxID=397392 RepID=UPI0025AE17F1|nr:bZIP transcription factor 53 [Malania oleifera]